MRKLLLYQEALDMVRRHCWLIYKSGIYPPARTQDIYTEVCATEYPSLSQLPLCYT